jgi:uncharacterized protein YgiM (DUF1202 family)
MSNHNYNNYYKKFENNKNEVKEPEQAAPEITSGIPDVPGVAKAAEVTVLEPEVTTEPEVSTEPEVTTEPEAKKGIVSNCAKLNVREKPVAGSRVVSIIDANTELTVTIDESIGNFYKICTASGVEGYCVKDYVRLV